MHDCCGHHHSPLLFDLGPAPEDATDYALESLYKAMGDPPGDDDGTWKPHHSPLIRQLIEDFTKRGKKALGGVLDGLLSVFGQRTGRKLRLPDPEPMMDRWDADQIGRTRFYLETKHTDSYTADDWMMVVDYLVQRYLPQDFARTEAEWLAIRTGIMGKIAAHMPDAEADVADQVLDRIPAGPMTPEILAREIVPLVGQIMPLQQAVMEFGQARTAMHITSLTDAMRGRIKGEILQHREQVFLGDPRPGALQTRLFDNFSQLNRDWRRIAVTETGEMFGQGTLASLATGSRVKRVERYPTACPFCRRIDGMVFTVVDPSKANKNPWTEMWVGSTNVGKSASPRKRVGDVLVDRDPSELWTPVPGVVHPHCRGTLLPLDDSPSDSEFSRSLRDKLRRM
jgi:hypothetical protein